MYKYRAQHMRLYSIISVTHVLPMDTRCSVCCVVLIPLEDSQGNAAAEQSYLTLSGLLPSCGYWGKRNSSMQADGLSHQICSDAQQCDSVWQ